MGFDVENNLGVVEPSMSSLERDGHSARAAAPSRSYATTVEDLWDTVTKRRAYSALVSADQWRTRTRLPLSVGRQRRRRDHGVRSTTTFRAHMGVRQGRQLGGGTFLGRWSRLRAAYSHAHRAPSGTLGRVGAGNGRSWLGDGSHGTRDPSHATDRAKAGRSHFCHFTGGKIGSDRAS